jgi:hypothetical protein
VVFMAEEEDPVRVIELAGVYGRLVDPARTRARGVLVFTDLDPRRPATNTPALRAAWAAWYRSFASTLDEKELLRTARQVLPPVESVVIGEPPREELREIPPLDYALSSAVLAGARAAELDSPLLKYFGLRNATIRRQQLAAALLRARDPALTELTVVRLFQVRDADEWRNAFLESLASEVGTWATALRAAMMVSNGPSGTALVSIWRARPDLRAPMLQAAVEAAERSQTVAPGSARATEEIAKTFREMGRVLCHVPEGTEFVARFHKTVCEEERARYR